MNFIARDFGTVLPGDLLFAPEQFTVELSDAEGVSAIIPQWRDLESRALEGNAFYSAAFVLAAASHLKESGAPHFVLVFDEGVLPRRLLGLLPVRHSRLNFAGSMLRGWNNAYVTLGAPLVDRDEAQAVLFAALRFLPEAFPDMTSFALPDIDLDGLLARAIRRAATQAGLPVATLSLHQRAVLDTSGGAIGFESNRKRRKEAGRHRRRLGELGAMRFQLLNSYEDVRGGLEHFLALEARGWKGARGTALVQTPGRASFTRTMVWSLARAGAVSIGVLELDGVAIASALMLKSGDRGFLWKIAYDEAYARYSPGVLLIEDLSRAMLGDRAISRIDSCAQEGNAMIEGMWLGRIRIADMIVGLDPHGAPAFKAALAREQFRRSLRSRVKAIYRRLRGWDQA